MLIGGKNESERNPAEKKRNGRRSEIRELGMGKKLMKVALLARLALQRLP